MQRLAPTGSNMTNSRLPGGDRNGHVGEKIDRGLKRHQRLIQIGNRGELGTFRVQRQTPPRSGQGVRNQHVDPIGMRGGAIRGNVRFVQRRMYFEHVVGVAEIFDCKLPVAFELERIVVRVPELTQIPTREV